MAGKTSTRIWLLHAAHATSELVLAASLLNDALQLVQLSTNEFLCVLINMSSCCRFALKRDNHECVLECWSIGVLDASKFENWVLY